ncbi:MAG: translation initiation factor IF-2 [Pelagibacteraceae bacterium]|nr:translation initiation factor IF-2 [Pelagibacteraceae bacterium]
MQKDKNKKKTLTISGSFNKKIDSTSSDRSGKKSFLIDRKKSFKTSFKPKKFSQNLSKDKGKPSKKNFARKLVEQQATKRFIHPESKKIKERTSAKSKDLKSGREFKLTISRAMNVEEFEIKQRSLASVKRARLKEKKNINANDPKKEFKKVIRDVKIPDQITIQELSNRMAEQSSTIIKFLLNMGVTATINHSIDKDTAEYIVKEFGHTPVLEQAPTTDLNKKENLDKSNFQSRPPVITIMGHVDHGKTSLLDALRNTNVVSSEHGGITQHIGAYQVYANDKKLITFIDTPGHAAFTEMRARGSKITDIVVLVIAADDGVKPQTVEAIQHAKAAKVPIIVAINKCDLPGKNIDKIKNDLMRYELIAESLSGDTLFVEVSAKNKMNLDKLKESIILQSELLDLKASKEGNAKGIVLEAKIDKGKGPVATILVTSGELKKGNYFVCGNTFGKIRAMIDFNGKNIDKAYPSSPLEILGMNEAANAGDEFFVVDTEDEAKKISAFRKTGVKESNVLIAKDKTKLFDKENNKTELNIIIKSDVQGSAEALRTAISKIEHAEVEPKIILSDIGMINETDVSLAKASNAIIIGFNMKPNREAKKVAEEQKVRIEFFNIIYKAIEFMEKSLSGLLEPERKEKIEGIAEILKIFKLSKFGKVAGSKVTEGEIKNNSKTRIVRDGKVVYDGSILSIFREKNAVKEVNNGLECGISFKNFEDFKEKDIIESYKVDIINRGIND